MANTIWIEYIHNKLAQRGVLPVQAFSFSEEADESDYDITSRDAVRLAERTDFGRGGSRECADRFRNAWKREFMEGGALNLALSEKNADFYQHAATFIPVNQYGRYRRAAPGRIYNSIDLASEFKALVMRVIFERNLIHSESFGDMIAYNLAFVEFNSPDGLLAQGVNFGGDFAAHHEVGYAVSGCFNPGERRAQLIRASEKFRTLFQNNVIDDLGPKDAADKFIGLVSELFGRGEGLVRLV